MSVKCNTIDLGEARPLPTEALTKVSVKPMSIGRIWRAIHATTLARAGSLRFADDDLLRCEVPACPAQVLLEVPPSLLDLLLDARKSARSVWVLVELPGSRLDFGLQLCRP
jgi:hypothetical protein